MPENGDADPAAATGAPSAAAAVPTDPAPKDAAAAPPAGKPADGDAAGAAADAGAEENDRQANVVSWCREYLAEIIKQQTAKEGTIEDALVQTETLGARRNAGIGALLLACSPRLATGVGLRHRAPCQRVRDAH